MKTNRAATFGRSALTTGILIALASPALAQDAEILSPVTVTATTTSHSKSKAPASISVLTQEDIREMPINDLSDVLKRLPGVYQGAGNGTGRSDVSIRGLGSKYTLVLIDGKRISTGEVLWRGSDFDTSPVPLSDIERVEVIRGPMSALYGSDAIGGVVNIITKGPSSDWTGSLTSTYQTTDDTGGEQIRNGVSARGPLSEDVFFKVNAETYNRNAWQPDESSQVPRLEEKQTRNLNATVSWMMSDNQSLDFDYRHSNDERPLDYYAPGRTREQEVDRDLFSLTHKGYWSWGDTTVQAQYETAEIEDYNSSFAVIDPPADRSYEQKNMLINGYSNFRLGDHAITAGVEARRDKVVDQYTYTDTGEDETDRYAVYLQDEIGLTNDLALTLGGRYDHHQDFGGHFTPRAYLVYGLNESVTLKGGVSQAFKAPGPYQLNPNYQLVSCGGSCFITGDPDLEPETSTNYEMAVDVQRERWNATLTLFKNDVEDMIDAPYIPGETQRVWTNISEVDIHGVEFEGAVRLTDTLGLSGNYTYLDTEDGNGDPLTARPDHKATVRLDWDMTGQIHSFLAANHHGEQYIAPRGSDPEYTESYQTVDLGLGYAFSRHLDLRLGIKNATDERPVDDNPNYPVIQLGRSYYVSGSYRF
ncbi:TonB-dependent receptor [Guyparkeria halophila]|uniref:TonB-dependent receptor n=1 Tax=Guyparkeria halophila TaxID=47960 RepID=A0ABZ0YZM5_9GAMM|nr:TonB-dependent receptor [Guyparkeria halophila]WQH16672.1 TonB-dependent receptor [Guyparkeria halophila]